MRYYILIFLVFTIVSCERTLPTEETVLQIPENLLSKEVFTEMYYDAQLTEGAVRSEISKGGKSDEISRYLYEQLFEKYKISEADFKANIKYYASDPEAMQEIQTEVVNRLSLEESKLMNQ